MIEIVESNRVHELLAERGMAIYALSRLIGRSNSRTTEMLLQRGATWENVLKVAAAIGVAPEDIAEPATLPQNPRIAYGRWLSAMEVS